MSVLDKASPGLVYELSRRLLDASEAEIVTMWGTLDAAGRRVVAEILADDDFKLAARAKRMEGTARALEADWRLWLPRIMPKVFTKPWAPYHEAFWEWLWAIDAERPLPYAAIWPRSAAKSSSAEGGVVALAARGRRRYGLYIGATTDAANRHVEAIGTILESAAIQEFYPQLGQRRVNKYGSPLGWRRSRLVTASGFTLDALGMDVAMRGIRFENQRPDLIVVDDIDDPTDGPKQIEHNREVITKALLPASSTNVAVLFIQNLIHRQGIFAQLARLPDVVPADFLSDRIVSGPIPAMEGFEYAERLQDDGSTRYVITHGVPTWPGGMGWDECQAIINNEGPTAFLTEHQHLAEPPSGGLWGKDFPFQRCNPDEVPDLVSTCVWVDPAVSDKDDSDSQAIQVDGRAANGTIYRLYSWEQRSSPEATLKRALRLALEYGADHVGVETDQGGDTWISVVKQARDQLKADMMEAGEELPTRWPTFRSEKAGAIPNREKVATSQGPKAARAGRMLSDYERPGRIVHVRGFHEILERALRRAYRTKPFDLADAAFWGWRDLDMQRRQRATVSSAAGRSLDEL